MSHFYKIFCYSCQEYEILVLLRFPIPTLSSKNPNTESAQEILLKVLVKKCHKEELPWCISGFKRNVFICYFWLCFTELPYILCV